MRKKKFSVLGGRSWISGLHRYLFVAALIWAWQVIALDRANVYKNNTLSLGDTVRFEAYSPVLSDRLPPPNSK